LLSDADIGIHRSTIGLPAEWQGHACEAFDGGNPALLEFVDLDCRNPCCEAKVIVIAAALVADFPPAADIEMFLRV
jgi:hypothetical protein